MLTWQRRGFHVWSAAAMASMSLPVLCDRSVGVQPPLLVKHWGGGGCFQTSGWKVDKTQTLGVSELSPLHYFYTDVRFRGCRKSGRIGTSSPRARSWHTASERGQRWSAPAPPGTTRTPRICTGSSAALNPFMLRTSSCPPETLLERRRGKLVEREDDQGRG